MPKRMIAILTFLALLLSLFVSITPASAVSGLDPLLAPPTLLVEEDPENPTGTLLVTTLHQQENDIVTQWSENPDFAEPQALEGEKLDNLPPDTTVHVRSRVEEGETYSLWAEATGTTRLPAVELTGILPDSASPDHAVMVRWTTTDDIYPVEIQASATEDFETVAGTTTAASTGNGGWGVVTGLPAGAVMHVRTRLRTDTNSSVWSTPMSTTTHGSLVTPTTPTIDVEGGPDKADVWNLKVEVPSDPNSQGVILWTGNPDNVSLYGTYTSDPASPTVVDVAISKDVPLPIVLRSAYCYSKCYSLEPSEVSTGPTQEISWGPLTGSLTGSDVFLAADGLNDISVYWSPPNARLAEAGSYEAQWDEDPTFSSPSPVIFEEGTYQLKGVKDNTLVHLRLRSTDAAISPWTTMVIAPGAPLPPTDLAASIPTNASDPGTTLHWAKASGATGYQVARSIDENIVPMALADVPAVDTEFTFLGGDLNQTYWMYVRSVGEHGHSPWAKLEVTASLLPPPAPDSVTVTTPAGGESLTATWKAVPAAKSYKVYVNGVFRSNVTGISYALTGLTPNTLYNVTVKAVNQAGESVTSAMGSAYTSALPTSPTAPTAPTPRVISNSGVDATGALKTTVQVSWPSVPGAKNYEILLDGKSYPCDPASISVDLAAPSCTIILDMTDKKHEVVLMVNGTVAKSPPSPPVPVVIPAIPGRPYPPVDIIVHIPGGVTGGSGPRTEIPVEPNYCPFGCAGEAPLTTTEFGFRWAPVAFAKSYNVYFNNEPVVEITDGSTYHKVQVIAGTTNTFRVTANIAPPTDEPLLVVLGDSYSSGEGTFQYDVSQGDVPDEGKKCHRSSLSWGFETTRTGVTDGGDELHEDPLFLACSGARSYNLMGNLPGGAPADARQNGHAHQLEILKTLVDADADVRAVAFTIGGNDAGFAGVGSACVMGDCAANILATDIAQEGNVSAHQLLTVLPDRLETLYSSVAAAAPGARIYTGGYPVKLHVDVDAQNKPLDQPPAGTAHEFCQRFANAQVGPLAVRNDYALIAQQVKEPILLNGFADPQGRGLWDYLGVTNSWGVTNPERHALNNFVGALNYRIATGVNNYNAGKPASEQVTYVDRVFDNNDYCTSYRSIEGNEQESYLNGIIVGDTEHQDFQWWEMLRPSTTTQFFDNNIGILTGGSFSAPDAESFHPNAAGNKAWSTAWVSAINKDTPQGSASTQTVINAGSTMDDSGANPAVVTGPEPLTLPCHLLDATTKITCGPQRMYVPNENRDVTLPVITSTGWAPGAEVNVTVVAADGTSVGVAARHLANASGIVTIPPVNLDGFPAGTYTLVVQGPSPILGGGSKTTHREAEIIVASAPVRNPAVEDATPTGLVVTWDDPLAGRELLMAYAPASDPQNARFAVVNGESTSTALSSLASGTIYSISFLTQENGVDSGWSKPFLARTEGIAPQPATDVSAEAVDDGRGTVRVSFTPPVDSGTSEVTKYTALDVATGQRVSGTSSPLTFTGLESGSEHTFTVMAESKDGFSEPSGPSVVVLVPSWAPGDLEAAVDSSVLGNAIKLSWSSTKTYPLTYEAESSPTKEFVDGAVTAHAVTATKNGGTSSTTIRGLAAVSEYWWRVRAVGPTGVSSSWVYTTIPSVTSLSAPTNLVAVPNTGNSPYDQNMVRVTWDDQPNALWEVQYADDADFTYPQNVGELSPDAGAVLGGAEATLYHVRVRAHHPGMEPSAWMSTSTRTLPSGPSFYVNWARSSPDTSLEVTWGQYEDERWWWYGEPPIETTYQEGSLWETQYSLEAYDGTYNFQGVTAVYLPSRNGRQTLILEGLTPDSYYITRMRQVDPSGAALSYWRYDGGFPTLISSANNLTAHYQANLHSVVLDTGATASGSWEVQLSDEAAFVPSTTETLAFPGNQSILALSSEHVPALGSELHYRVRNHRSDGSVSVWTANVLQAPSDAPLGTALTYDFVTADFETGAGPQSTLHWNQPSLDTVVNIEYGRYRFYNPDQTYDNQLTTAPGAKDAVLFVESLRSISGRMQWVVAGVPGPWVSFEHHLTPRAPTYLGTEFIWVPDDDRATGQEVFLPQANVHWEHFREGYIDVQMAHSADFRDARALESYEIYDGEHRGWTPRKPLEVAPDAEIVSIRDTVRPDAPLYMRARSCIERCSEWTVQEIAPPAPVPHLQAEVYSPWGYEQGYDENHLEVGWWNPLEDTAVELQYSTDEDFSTGTAQMMLTNEEYPVDEWRHPYYARWVRLPDLQPETLYHLRARYIVDGVPGEWEKVSASTGREFACGDTDNGQEPCA